MIGNSTTYRVLTDSVYNYKFICLDIGDNRLCTSIVIPLYSYLNFVYAGKGGIIGIHAQIKDDGKQILFPENSHALTYPSFNFNILTNQVQLPASDLYYIYGIK